MRDDADVGDNQGEGEGAYALILWVGQSLSFPW